MMNFDGFTRLDSYFQISNFVFPDQEKVTVSDGAVQRPFCMKAQLHLSLSFGTIYHFLELQGFQEPNISSSLLGFGQNEEILLVGEAALLLLS